eukprot:1831583-Amphidinium_carterae.1
MFVHDAQLRPSSQYVLGVRSLQRSCNLDIHRQALQDIHSKAQASPLARQDVLQSKLSPPLCR